MSREFGLRVIQFVGFILALFLVYRLVVTNHLEGSDYVIMAVVCIISIFIGFQRGKRK